MAMEMTIEKINPTTAEKYLKRNVNNYRTMSRAKVNLYAAEMKAGKWQLNGEGIMFDETGRLLNGQHRLAAILVSGETVEMTVIRGVSDSVTIYDSGSNRSTMQIAKASGCEDITNKEASCGVAIAGRFQQISKGLVLDWLKDHHTEVKRAARACGATSSGNLSSRTSCILAAYMMLNEQKPYYELEVFFRVFNTGNTIGADGYEPSPALVARRMFMERYKGSSGRSQMEQTEVLVLALLDFFKKRKRQLNYKVAEPMECMKIMDRIRNADGLTKGA